MLKDPASEHVSLEECKSCPWKNNSPENIPDSVLRTVGSLVWDTLDKSWCGICGCNLGIKSMLPGTKCPLEDKEYIKDSEVTEWRMSKWSSLKKGLPADKYNELIKKRFEEV